MEHEGEIEALEMRLLLEAIHARYGYDLRDYSPTSMKRRIEAALARSGILSPVGTARAVGDVVLPRRRVDGDSAVAAVIGARLGREAAIGLVDPLLGGIHAGHTDSLSIDAVAPQSLRDFREAVQ